MPEGSIQQYAKAKRNGEYRKVYKEIEDGTFQDEGVEVYWGSIPVRRIRWK